jgi:hypothetical protein
MRIFLACIVLALLAGCGGQQQRVYGVEQETTIVIRAVQLVGSTVTITPSFSKTVTEDDLTPYPVGAPGAKNREIEDLEAVTVKVDPGTHRVKVARNGATVLEQEVYLGQGQTRELRIR